MQESKSAIDSFSFDQTVMTGKSHVLVIPIAAQGHVSSLVKLSLQIAAHGVKVTFVNSESTHEKIMASMPAKHDDEDESLLSFASIAEVSELENEESKRKVKTDQLKKLIEKINQKYGTNNEQIISCVIADISAGWALEVAKNMGIEGVGVHTAGPAGLALSLRVQQLIEAGILGEEGTLLKGESISLSNEIPTWRKSDMPWNSTDLISGKAIFRLVCNTAQNVKFTNLILSNSFEELAPSALKLIPNVLPIGPLLASNHSGSFAWSFWPEDSTCLSWLDKQTAGSVIYVAFGSLAILRPQQLDELALGLELSGHPFLWVVRSNLIKGSSTKFPEGFEKRVADRGKIVEWAPQEKVLAHPSVSCFLSHCGWNSTMEGLSMGVPFLCWPYFADQFQNRNYICDVWNIGLSLIGDENGIVTRHEISTKIKILISSDGIKANALHLKEVARKSIDENGSSFNNFKSFIERVKAV
ncbi:hypothetical protein PTKIN_Ptkin04bG0061000 [Pterospermum kingtungense]